MIVEISAGYIDTQPSALQLRLDVPALPAEASRTVMTGAGRIELRLLSASHQVVLVQDGDELIETLACLGGARDPLPTERTSWLGPFEHTVRARVISPDSAGFADTVARLIDEAGDDALIGRYPGDPLATTGVVVDHAGSRTWRTWHSYPQVGQIVLTETQIARRALAPTSNAASVGAC